jgi:hypothetical protein
MIEVQITKDMLYEAQEKASELGILNHSILKGKGNFTGFLGEQIALQVLGGEWCNTYNYDIILDGKRIDVKTKQTTVKPLPHYECSVAAYNTKQDCDEYAFVRVLKDYTVGWFLGSISKKEYFEMARFLRKGDIDPSNDFTVRADCYNLSIDSLGDTYETNT